MCHCVCKLARRQTNDETTTAPLRTRACSVGNPTLPCLLRSISPLPRPSASPPGRAALRPSAGVTGGVPQGGTGTHTGRRFVSDVVLQPVCMFAFACVCGQQRPVHCQCHCHSAAVLLRALPLAKKEQKRLFAYKLHFQTRYIDLSVPSVCRFYSYLGQSDAVQ